MIYECTDFNGNDQRGPSSSRPKIRTTRRLTRKRRFAPLIVGRDIDLFTFNAKLATMGPRVPGDYQCASSVDEVDIDEDEGSLEENSLELTESGDRVEAVPDDEEDDDDRTKGRYWVLLLGRHFIERCVDREPYLTGRSLLFLLLLTNSHAQNHREVRQLCYCCECSSRPGDPSTSIHLSTIRNNSHNLCIARSGSHIGALLHAYGQCCVQGSRQLQL